MEWKLNLYQENTKGNEIKKIEDSGFKVYKLRARKNKSEHKETQHSHWLGVTQTGALSVLI
ncbi:MAG: hypothetical protein CM15mP86_19540 [Gammaproteobacteria bacterium]|nr:MAG: hypothetical protein CM15mP86_19540 [Gammaproteobacteria bacterium]